MFISLSWEKTFIYIIFFSPLYFLRKYLNGKVKDKNFQTLIDAFSKFLIIIFYIIEKIKSKTEKEKEKEKENYDELINNSERFFQLRNLKKKNQKSKIINIIILIFCYNIFDLVSLYLKDKCKLINYSKCTDVIIFILIDIIVFQNNFYSHQKISISIGIVLIIIFFIIDFKKFMNIQFFILILLGYGYGFSRFIMKDINTNYFVSIYLLSSLNGIFQSIFHIINIFFVLKKTINIEYNKLHYIILYLINCLFINFLYFYIIFILTPIHCLICYNFAFIIYDLLNKKGFFIEIGLLEIIPLISSCIYLEIIELNFCDLDMNLKKNIKIRGIIENGDKKSKIMSSEDSSSESELKGKMSKNIINNESEYCVL